MATCDNHSDHPHTHSELLRREQQHRPC